MIFLHPTTIEIREFRTLARTLLQAPVVQQMSAYTQHGETTCLAHCVAVAWFSFLVYKRLGLRGQEHELIRAALLHDFFLYDWHEPGHPRLHGFYHPRIAAQNAVEHFNITPLEENTILCHMWPLTILPPAHRLGWIVTMVDKACSIAEVFGCRYRSFLKPRRRLCHA